MSQKAIWLMGLVVIVLLLIGSMLAMNTGVQAAPAPTATPDAIADPVLGDVDLQAVHEIDLTTLPLIPEISAYARTLYQAGLARGNDPHTFIKVGDCMTHNPYFLIPIGDDNYDLGDYQGLQAVIQNFSEGEMNSFSHESQASAGGFNAASVLDSLWANPEYCEAGETPLSCEIRIMQPSIALIMFGTNDVFYLDEAQFDFFYRSIVVAAIRQDILPVLSTFPQRPEFPEKSVLYNQIVAQIAQDYDVPLINLWLALDPLPNNGIDPDDTTHMSTPADGAACYFIGPNLEAGFTMRNLLTLQALDAVLHAADQN
jgi:hypothetical protein